MEEWKTYNICDVCQSISETYRGNAASVVLINTSDVLDGEFLTHEEVPNKDLKGQFKKVFHENNILYSEIRPANKRFAFVGFEPQDYIASTKLMVIRANEKVLPRFLFHYLKSEQTICELQALAESRSGTFPQITFSELGNLEISLPSIETQKRIAGFLDSIEDKIKLNNRINHNLEEQLSSKYESLLRTSSHRVNLSNFARKITDGVHNTVIDCAEGMFNLLSCKNLKDGCVVVNNVERRISKDTFQILRKRTQLEQWDILLSSVGTIGEIVLLKEDPLNYEFQRSVAMIKACDRQDACIIYSALKRQKNELIHSAHGAVQQCLFLSDINGFEIEVPDNGETINVFGKYAIAVHNVIAENQKENIELGLLRDSLLPRLMSGELNITGIDC